MFYSLYTRPAEEFSRSKDDEKRATAAHSYLVKRRKLHYIKEWSEVNKSIDVLLISDDHFMISDIQILPETIIFVNTKNAVFENENYALEFSSESLKVFKTK